MNLHQPLSVLPGIGPKSAEKYKKLGIETVEDLLLYFPFRYEDFKTKNVLDLKMEKKQLFLELLPLQLMSSIMVTSVTGFALPLNKGSWS